MLQDQLTDATALNHSTVGTDRPIDMSSAYNFSSRQLKRHKSAPIQSSNSPSSSSSSSSRQKKYMPAGIAAADYDETHSQNTDGDCSVGRAEKSTIGYAQPSSSEGRGVVTTGEGNAVDRYSDDDAAIAGGGAGGRVEKGGGGSRLPRSPVKPVRTSSASTSMVSMTPPTTPPLDRSIKLQPRRNPIRRSKSDGSGSSCSSRYHSHSRSSRSISSSRSQSRSERDKEDEEMLKTGRLSGSGSGSESEDSNSDYLDDSASDTSDVSPDASDVSPDASDGALPPLPLEPPPYDPAITIIRRKRSGSGGSKLSNSHNGNYGNSSRSINVSSMSETPPGAEKGGGSSVQGSLGGSPDSECSQPSDDDGREDSVSAEGAGASRKDIDDYGERLLQEIDGDEDGDGSIASGSDETNSPTSSIVASQGSEADNDDGKSKIGEGKSITTGHLTSVGYGEEPSQGLPPFSPPPSPTKLSRATGSMFDFPSSSHTSSSSSSTLSPTKLSRATGSIFDFPSSSHTSSSSSTLSPTKLSRATGSMFDFPSSSHTSSSSSTPSPPAPTSSSSSSPPSPFSTAPYPLSHSNHNDTDISPPSAERTRDGSMDNPYVYLDVDLGDATNGIDSVRVELDSEPMVSKMFGLVQQTYSGSGNV